MWGGTTFSIEHWATSVLTLPEVMALCSKHHKILITQSRTSLRAGNTRVKWGKADAYCELLRGIPVRQCMESYWVDTRRVSISVNLLLGGG